MRRQIKRVVADIADGIVDCSYVLWETKFLMLKW